MPSIASRNILRVAAYSRWPGLRCASSISDDSRTPTPPARRTAASRGAACARPMRRIRLRTTRRPCSDAALIPTGPIPSGVWNSKSRRRAARSNRRRAGLERARERHGQRHRERRAPGRRKPGLRDPPVGRFAEEVEIVVQHLRDGARSGPASSGGRPDASPRSRAVIVHVFV